MRAGITFTGKREHHSGFGRARARTETKGEGCVSDVESNWEDWDQFKWMGTVQEVVTGGETDWWLTDTHSTLLQDFIPLYLRQKLRFGIVLVSLYPCLLRPLRLFSHLCFLFNPVVALVTFRWDSFDPLPGLDVVLSLVIIWDYLVFLTDGVTSRSLPGHTGFYNSTCLFNPYCIAEKKQFRTHVCDTLDITWNYVQNYARLSVRTTVRPEAR